MSQIRYECTLIERAFAREYGAALEVYLGRLQGLNDIKPLVHEFEREFAAYIGVRHAVAVNSGSDALQLSLRVLGIGKGDEVIIPDLTYQAVALAVAYVGATPIVVDVRQDDLTMDVEQVAGHVTRRTKVLIAAHMFARPCDMEALRALCQRHKIALVEDVCQAESSTLNGRMLGSFGDLAAFSFSYYKPLSSCGGGGGMVVFNQPEHLRISRWMEDWRDDPELLDLGHRFPPIYFMDLVALRVKFRNLKKIVSFRKKIKVVYEQGLGDLKNAQIFTDRPGVDSVPQNFVVLCDQRDKLREGLAKEGISAQSPYVPLHRMAAFRRNSAKDFPVSERYFQSGLHLPLYSFMSEQKAGQVVEVCRKFLSKRKLSS